MLRTILQILEFMLLIPLGLLESGDPWAQGCRAASSSFFNFSNLMANSFFSFFKFLASCSAIFDLRDKVAFSKRNWAVCREERYQIRDSQVSAGEVLLQGKFIKHWPTWNRWVSQGSITKISSSSKRFCFLCLERCADARFDDILHQNPHKGLSSKESQLFVSNKQYFLPCIKGICSHTSVENSEDTPPKKWVYLVAFISTVIVKRDSNLVPQLMLSSELSLSFRKLWRHSQHFQKLEKLIFLWNFTCACTSLHRQFNFCSSKSSIRIGWAQMGVSQSRKCCICSWWNKGGLAIFHDMLQIAYH